MIKISYNPDEEMMSISNDNKTIFYGNYSDFPRDPVALSKIIAELTEQEVFCDKDLMSLG